jgi:uncharacterized membrane protein
MPDTAAYCPGCGRPMSNVPRAQGTVGALPETVAGALAYLFVPAIVFLLVDPYNKNRFVRFHSYQSIMWAVAAVLAGTAARIVGAILSIIPFLGHLLSYLLVSVVGLAVFVIWLVLLVKALQGERFKLSVLGDLAEKQAGAI